MTRVYKITNIITGDCYVGATRNALGRFQIHISELKRNAHHCKALQKAFNESSIENFTFSIIEECNDSEFQRTEQKWIDYYIQKQQCYNTFTIATDKGLDTLETRERKSLAAMGNKNSLGRVVSEEEKEKSRQRNLGKKMSPEAIEKMRQSKIGIESTKKIAVLQYELGTETIIREWKSATDAAKALGLVRNNIVKVLKGERKHCGYYDWRYKEDDDETGCVKIPLNGESFLLL